MKNARHEVFAQTLADGKSEADAYKAAYNAKASVCRANAPRLLGKASVRARVDWLKEQNAKVKALTRERKREILAAIAESSREDSRARIAAIQEDNRMTGEADDSLNLNLKGSFKLDW